MISSVEVHNYRSIKSATMGLQALNAIVGPNNAGKSNVLRAIGTVLGPKWPPNALSEEDRNRDAEGASIIIKVRFDTPIPKDYYGTTFQAHGFELEWRAEDNSEFNCLDYQGQTLTNKYGNPVRVDNELRRKVPALHVDAKRDLSRELGASQWTILGKILKAIEGQLSGDEAFMKKFTAQADGMAKLLLEKPVKELESTLNNEMRGISGFHDLNLSFEAPVLLESLKLLQVHVRETKDLPASRAEELGQGLQSALVVALVRAYQRIHHVSPLLLLEEPESYLHPQARRAFFTLLDETSSSGACQVVYTTHSSEFVEITKPERISLVRKSAPKGTYVVQGKSGLFTPGQRAELKAICEFDTHAREMLFSTCVLVCEGDAEAVSLPVLLKRAGADPDVRGWTVVSTGSKDNLPFFLKIGAHFELAQVAILDEDTDKPDYQAKHVQLNKDIASAVGKRGGTWMSRPDFEKAHGIPGGQSKPREALGWARARTGPEAKAIVDSLIKEADRVSAT